MQNYTSNSEKDTSMDKYLINKPGSSFFNIEF